MKLSQMCHSPVGCPTVGSSALSGAWRGTFKDLKGLRYTNRNAYIFRSLFNMMGNDDD